MTDGYNKPNSTTFHVAQRCSGTMFHAIHGISSQAAQNRGLSPCRSCCGGEWPHEEEQNDD